MYAGSAVGGKPLVLSSRTGPVVPMPSAARRPRTDLVVPDPSKEIALLRSHLVACFDEIHALRDELARAKVWRIQHEPTGPEGRFEALRQLWREDVADVSDLREIVDHPAYSAIIAMGPDVVPSILRDLARGPGHWHVALRTITGEQPVPVGDAGRLDAIREHWLAWGRARQRVE